MNKFEEAKSFSRVTVFVVALESYRKPSRGESLPPVKFAHADGDAFADAIDGVYGNLAATDLNISILKDGNASLTALRDELKHTVKNLAKDELFIFYYAGHGFYGAGGNRLSAYDTNHANIEGTSLSMRDDLLEPLKQSECRQALVFIDACAENFKEILTSRDVISSLDTTEIDEYLNNGWYCGVFLSCSPGEKSYPSSKLKHGIWTHFLLEALTGRATDALTQDRWLTDFGLRDYLHREIQRFITREMQVPGTQTPQAILSGSNSFQIHHIPPAAPANAVFAGITLENTNEFLEGIETGKIRNLPGFSSGKHKVPTDLNDYAEAWCQRLLTERLAEELQELYEVSRSALKARRKDVQKVADTGAGDLDTAAFRYSIESGQNPDNPADYIIRRSLELRQDWNIHRAAIDKIFENEFDRLVIELEKMDNNFDNLVDKLDDIQESHGGDISDDDRTKRATYSRDGVMFTFDLNKRRLEISFGTCGTLQLVDAAQKLQLGHTHESAMLARQIKSD